MAITPRVVLLFTHEETASLFEAYYEPAAMNILSGRGLSIPHEGTLVPLTLYPPGYSLFIAGIYEVFGQHAVVVRICQILLSGLATVAFARVMRCYFSSRPFCLGIALVFALNPLFWVQDVTVNTAASLATSLMIFSLLMLHRAIADRHRNMSAALAGLLIAAAASVRSEFILLAIAYLVILVVKSTHRWRSALFYLAGASLVLGSMSARNAKNFDVLSPLPGGVGINMVNVIGKFYPDPSKGFAFGDRAVLAAEGGNFTDLTYPDPFGRDHARLARSVEFIRENPGKFLRVMVLNTPRAWFGQQLYIAGSNVGFQESAARGIGYVDFALAHPTKMIDIALGFLISLSIFALAIVGVITQRSRSLSLSPFLFCAAAFLLAFIPLGTLGRYTLPAYLFLTPVACVGIARLLGRRPQCFAQS